MAKKILIVDDDKQIVSLLASRLKAQKYEIVVAYDGVQAVAKAFSEKPDLILLDMKMPGGDGLQVIENLKSSADTALIPIIVVTAFPSQEMRQKSKEMGALDLIAKPFEAQDMLSRIKEALGEESPGSAASPNGAKTILLVDDEPQIVGLLKSRLEKSGYRVIVANDGQEALDKTSQGNPDLIILDIMLPKIDGYQVCKTLRSDERYRDIPVIMLTGRTLARDIKTGMELGAVSYVQKPFEPDVLLGIIQGMIKK